MSGFRIETWEGVNTEHQYQLKPETAVIYRKGLAKTDLSKETMTLQIRNMICIG